MPENKNERKNVSLSDILGDSVETERNQRPSESRVNKTLDEIIDFKKKAMEIRTIESLEGGNQGGGQVGAAQEIAELLNSLGINPGKMAAAQADEVRQLKEASTAAERELHQMRLDKMREVEERVAKTLSDFAEKQKAITEAEKAKTAGLLGGNSSVNSAIERALTEALTARLNPPPPPNPFDEAVKWDAWKRQMQAIFPPPQPMVDPSLAAWNGNVEMYKTRTQYEIEMEKMKIQREASDAKTKSLTDMAQKFIDILPDAFAAYGEAVGKNKGEKDTTGDGSNQQRISASKPQPKKEVLAAPPAASNEEMIRQIGDFVEGECPHCHKIIPVPANPPAGITAICPYCKGSITFAVQEIPTAPPAASSAADKSQTDGEKKA